MQVIWQWSRCRPRQKEKKNMRWNSLPGERKQLKHAFSSHTLPEHQNMARFVRMLWPPRCAGVPHSPSYVLPSTCTYLPCQQKSWGWNMMKLLNPEKSFRLITWVFPTFYIFQRDHSSEQLAHVKRVSRSRDWWSSESVQTTHQGSRRLRCYRRMEGSLK